MKVEEKFEIFKKFIEKAMHMPDVFPDEVIILPLTDMEWKNIFTEKRVELVKTISEKSRSITQLAKVLNRHQEAISRDIKYLEDVGIVKVKIRGKERIPVIDKKLIVMPLPISAFEKKRI
jgi:predicted transcriptional regulator